MNKDGFIWTRRALLISLFLLAASGLLLHYRIHNFIDHDPAHPGFSGTYFLASLLPFIDAVLVTSLFLSRSTAVYGYLLNGMIVIYGTILMTHFSIEDLLSKSAPMKDWVIKSTLPDIGIAWGDFFAGKALYDLYLKE